MAFNNVSVRNVAVLVLLVVATADARFDLFKVLDSENKPYLLQSGTHLKYVNSLLVAIAANVLKIIGAKPNACAGTLKIIALVKLAAALVRFLPSAFVWT
ncbi:hypothetical protein PanWU01x14_142540 [Parasponia andersonii]|uniref:CASP-like protein n=1 Tax=Parasponia andersonii TaxID=3476 RepID=A0A2P5CLC2_PARAD|nr:hypothetical protein PanWU01x14_142540 [Parasponia andersonii]